MKARPAVETAFHRAWRKLSFMCGGCLVGNALILASVLLLVCLQVANDITWQHTIRRGGMIYSFYIWFVQTVAPCFLWFHLNFGLSWASLFFVFSVSLTL